MYCVSCHINQEDNDILQQGLLLNIGKKAFDNSSSLEKVEINHTSKIDKKKNFLKLHLQNVRHFLKLLRS